MSNHSSIFGFDTLQEIPKPNRVFFLTLFILICIGSLISMNRDFLEKISPRYQSLTNVLLYLENHRNDKPKVLFLGSSRFASCIQTDLFAKLLGLSSTEVINLSVDSGGFCESLVICRKNPWLLEYSSLIVIEIEPWMFNSNLLHPVYKNPYEFEPYFYIWSTFQERWDIPKFKTRLFLMIDYFWPLYERRTLAEWTSTLNSICTKRYDEGYLTIPIYKYKFDALQSHAKDVFYSAQSIVKCHFNDYKIAKHKATYLQELIHLTKKNNPQIVLLQPPVSKEYMESIYSDPFWRSTYKEVLSFINILNNHTIKIIWETPETCGLTNSVFIDYGHYNESGAQRFTHILFKKLYEIGIIKSESTMILQKNKDINNTILELYEKLKINPNNSELHCEIGTQYVKKNEYIKAIDHYQIALAIQPNNMSALINLATIYSNKGDTNSALFYLKRQLDLQTDNSDIYYNIACMYAKNKNIHESIIWLQKAVDKGFENWILLKTDKDLENIRDTSYYKKLTTDH